MGAKMFVERLSFGEYIASPKDKRHFEMRTHSKMVPCANELTVALHRLRQKAPGVQIRSQCEILESGFGYLHRWVFYCDHPSNSKTMERVMDFVMRAYEPSK